MSEASPEERADPAAGAPAEGADPSLDLLLRGLPQRVPFPRLRFFWWHKLTPAGRGFLVILVVAGAGASSFGVQYPMYLFAVFLTAVGVVARACGWIFRPRCRVERRLPERCAAGATVRVLARVTHTGRLLPAFDLALRETAEPPLLELDPRPRYHPQLSRGETAELSYRFTPTIRGAYDLPGPQVFSAFPFGLYNSARKLDDPHRLLVYPRFVPLRSLRLPTGRRHQPGGLALVSQVGDSEEFVGNREYRPGDRLRDLDQKAWARVGKPIVREFQQEYLTRVALVVDTFVPRRTRGAIRELEAAISLGAAMADALSRQEYVVDVFAAGPELYHFQAGRSLAYLDDILDVLACVEPCADVPFPTLAPALMEEIAQISTALIVLLDWDEERLRFVQAVQEQGVELKLALVRDRPPTQDPSGFACAGGPVERFSSAQVAAGVGEL